MTLSTIRTSINRLQREIGDLQKKLSTEKKKESEANIKMLRIQKSITKNTSPSLLTTKLNQIGRCQDDIAKANKNQADIQSKLTKKNQDLIKYQKQLSKEEEAARKKQEDFQKKLERDQQEQHKQIMQKLSVHSIQTSSNTISTTGADGEDFFDLFISHASEDKDDFVRPLVEALKAEGINVWYDEHTLKVGDRLRRSIDNGLRRSSFGVMVLSSAFFRKHWTQYEFDGLIAQEMATGNKRILPIWHKVTRDEVMKFSPSLGDIVALDSTRSTIEEIAKDLASLVK